MKIILLGPPGAGKGTQATRVAEHLGVPKAGSGDLFRDHLQQNTNLGQLADSYMKKGVLVPDSITIRMVMEWISTETTENGFLLDGFPRTLTQATALDEELGDGAIDRVLYVKVSQKELVRRLAGRVVCNNCNRTYHKISNPPPEDGACADCQGSLYQRDDDKPEAVEKRIEVFFTQTTPLINYYSIAGVLREVDGEQSIKMVEQAFIEALT